jgi:H+/Cl- antiporter ClcA
MTSMARRFSSWYARGRAAFAHGCPCAGQRGRRARASTPDRHDLHAAWWQELQRQTDESRRNDMLVAPRCCTQSRTSRAPAPGCCARGRIAGGARAHAVTRALVLTAPVPQARWFVCMAIGCCTGTLAFFIDILGAFLFSSKIAAAAPVVMDNQTQVPTDGMPSTAGTFGGALFSFVASSMALAAVASSLVIYVEPISGGSGIPDVKTYLQGVKVPRLLRTSTLACKSIGVMFSVAAGLMVGKEGPMIHCGAVIAAGLSQGSSKTFSFRTQWLKRFRNDHDKRDFVSAGAAAGVAAAFGAPIGGVLFAMEEAALYWSQTLTWRTFFCAMCSTMTLNVLLSAVSSGGSSFGRLSHPGLITFGAFMDDSDGRCDFRHL